MAMRLARQRQQQAHYALVEGVSTDTRMEMLSRSAHELSCLKSAACDSHSSKSSELCQSQTASNRVDAQIMQEREHPAKTGGRRKRFHRRRSRNRTVEIPPGTLQPLQGKPRNEAAAAGCAASSSSSSDGEELSLLDRNANHRDCENEPLRRVFKSRGATARRLQRRAAQAASVAFAADAMAAVPSVAAAVAGGGRWTPRLRSAGSEACLTKLVNNNSDDDDDSDFEKPPKRTLSVRNLDGSMTDFTDPNSVNKWASSIMNELQSLPSLQCCDGENSSKNDSRSVTPRAEDYQQALDVRMTVNSTVTFEFNMPSQEGRTSVLISTAKRHPQLTKSLSDLRHLTPNVSKTAVASKKSLDIPAHTTTTSSSSREPYFSHRRSQPAIVAGFDEQPQLRLTSTATSSSSTALEALKKKTINNNNSKMPIATNSAQSRATLDEWKRKAQCRAQQQLSQRQQFQQPHSSNMNRPTNEPQSPPARWQRPNGSAMISNGDAPHHRRSVHGVVRSLIQAAENSRRDAQGSADSRGSLLSPLRDAETQTSPSAQSCNSSFEYLCGEEGCRGLSPESARSPRVSSLSPEARQEPIYESPPDASPLLSDGSKTDQQRPDSANRLEMEIDASIAMLMEQVNSLYAPVSSSSSMSTPSPRPVPAVQQFPVDNEQHPAVSWRQNAEAPIVPLHRQSKSAVIRTLRKSRDASNLEGGGDNHRERRRIASYDNLAKAVETQVDDEELTKTKREHDDAIECCQWLRDAGFPQYAKMYEEHRFPIDLRTVHSDHEFLDRDSLTALYRRVRTLNQVAMTCGTDSAKLRQKRIRNRSNLLDSDESMLEELCELNKDEEEVAISRRWRYVRQSKTWSRVLDANEIDAFLAPPPSLPATKSTAVEASIRKQPQHMEITKAFDVAPSIRPEVPLMIHETIAADNIHNIERIGPTVPSKGLRRSQSERIKDRAREFVRRIDLRSTNRKKIVQTRTSDPATLVIGQPTLVSHFSASPRMMRMFPPKTADEQSHAGDASQSNAEIVILPAEKPESPAVVRSNHRYEDDRHDEPTVQLQRSSARLRQQRRRAILIDDPTNATVETRSLTDAGATSSSTSSLASSRLLTLGSDENNTAQRVALKPLKPKMGVQATNVNREQVVAIVHRDASDVDVEHKATHNKSSSGDYAQIIKKKKPDDGEKTAASCSNNATVQNQRHARPQLVVNEDGYYAHVTATVPYLKDTVDSNKSKTSPVRGARESPFSRSTGRSQSSLESGLDDSSPVQRGERRDSGVGSSLSRSPSGPTSERQRYSMLRIRHLGPASPAGDLPSPQKHSSSAIAEQRFVVSDPIPEADLMATIDALPISHIIKMRKMAYLKLTALFERSTPTVAGGMMAKIGATTASSAARNWTTVQRIMHRLISPNDTSRSAKIRSEFLVFGAPLTVIQQIDGTALPLCILNMMRYLRQMAACTDGLFRKSGVRSRVAELRTACEAGLLSGTENELNRCLRNFQVHDVADLLKQYFRELPEPLLTAKYSNDFMNIYTSLPTNARSEATQYALLLLPDENREALQTLIFFLHDIGRCASATNMNADSLAICFSPSLFQIGGQRFNSFVGSRRHKTVGAAAIPSSREFRELHAAQLCLRQMIDQCATLFVVPSQLRVDAALIDDCKQFELPLLNELGSPNCNYNGFLLQKSKELLKEHRNRWRGWLVEAVHDGVEISTRKSVDWHPLPLIRAWTDIAAPPRELLACIMRDRAHWDPATINWRTLATLNENCEIYQYVLNDTPGHPTRDVVVVRQWRYEMRELRGGCVLVERSLKASETQLLGGFSAALIDSRFLIEPYAGRSRLTHISRLDLRGRSLSWYTNVYTYRIAKQLANMRGLFQKLVGDSLGPETKV